MALDDFDSIPAGLRQSSAEDEDLFNFPAADLGEPTATLPATPARAPQPVPPTPPPAPVAPVATRAPIPPSPPSPPATARATPPETGAAAAVEDQTRAPLPSAKPAAQKSVLTSVAPDQEPPPAEPQLELARSIRPTVRARKSWLAMGVVLAVNIVGFAFLWASNRSYRTGLEGLRDDLVVTMHDLRRSTSGTPLSPQTAQQAAPSESHAPETAHAPAIPLAPHEETTLLLARQEIDEGEFLQARKRLYRLLAVADRIDPDLRKDIESRAMYLIGESYDRQADARRETKP